MVYQSITKVVFLATIYIQFITSIVHCHKHGAPNKSCKTLLPHHKHITYHETSAEIKTFIMVADYPEWFNTPVLTYLSMKKEFLGKTLEWGEFGTDKQVIALSSLLESLQRWNSKTVTNL